MFKQKHVYAAGAIVEMKVWVVPRNPKAPEGFKYSLVYIDRNGKRILGYDNAEGKGHHRHEGQGETPMQFQSIDQMTERFLKEVQDRRRPYEG